jgi:hypothetical protein
MQLRSKSNCGSITILPLRSMNPVWPPSTWPCGIEKAESLHVKGWRFVHDPNLSVLSRPDVARFNLNDQVAGRVDEAVDV